MVITSSGLLHWHQKQTAGHPELFIVRGQACFPDEFKKSQRGDVTGVGQLPMGWLQK
jgi:hypothetical protein